RHSSVVIAYGALAVADLDCMVPRENLVNRSGGGGRGRRLMVSMDGMKVDDVSDGPAAAAGVKPGDTIVAVDGKAVGDVDEMRERLREGGVKVMLTVKRDGKNVDLALNFPPPAESRPESR